MSRQKRKGIEVTEYVIWYFTSRTLTLWGLTFLKFGIYIIKLFLKVCRIAEYAKMKSKHKNLNLADLRNKILKIKYKYYQIVMKLFIMEECILKYERSLKITRVYTLCIV